MKYKIVKYVEKTYDNHNLKAGIHLVSLSKFQLVTENIKENLFEGFT